MMLNQFLINTAASQFRNNKRKPPWEDKKNYRVSKRGYHSHCHLWHNADEVADVRDAVWQARRKKRLTTVVKMVDFSYTTIVSHS